ncbi:FtsX-like permease family protein [Rheinheimera sp. YQF-2]|uniref:FtsX-like permease family protein n=1 Tax=Rheinheimera lutimaris TaxID=2740584 RepID=A0A7Y5AUU1_9GAMM|nr:FtsX-like permease family protein [Rheinheimera lutimaris]NRQ44375.1 FtsX-like permease family protein [Rheinheimera lutimaris]
MWFHYLLTALRHFKSQLRYQLLNLTGLAIGLTSSLMILTFLMQEISYDKQHPAISYRLDIQFNSLDNSRLAQVAGNMAPYLLQKQLITNALRIHRQSLTVHNRQLVNTLEQVAYTDPSLVDFFKITVQQGSIESVYQKPGSIALTASSAINLFGTAEALQQTFQDHDGNIWTVVAILDELPQETHLQFSAIASIDSLVMIEGNGRLDSWMRNDFYTYVQFTKSPKDSDRKLISDTLAQPLKNIVPQLELEFHLLKTSDIHLNGSSIGEMKFNGSKVQFYLFVAIAIIVLFVALFNYINFATALASKRALEVGVRQISGASKTQLMWQFLLESALFTLFASAIAFLLSALLLPYFGHYLQRELTIYQLLTPTYLALLFTGYLIISVTAGFYPALTLSNLAILSALRGAGLRGRSGRWFQQTLLFLQLVVSIALLIWVGHIALQLKMLQQIPVGYSSSNRLVAMHIDNEFLQQRFAHLQFELKQHSNIISVSAADAIPTEDKALFMQVRRQLRPELKLPNVMVNNIYPDFISTLNIPLLSGRELNIEDMTLTKNGYQRGQEFPVVLNMLAVQALGWSSAEQALGKRLDFSEHPDFSYARSALIVGIVDNYYLTSIHQPMRPQVLVTGMPMLSDASIILHVENDAERFAKSLFEQSWKRVSDKDLPAIELLSSRFRQLHQNDQLNGELTALATAMTVMIVSFGLMGCASYSTQRRLSELAIRKVLGASMTKLVLLLSRQFLFTVTFASLVAIIIAWWLTTNWLSSFSMQVPLNYWLFTMAPLSAIGLVLGITFLSLSLFRQYSLSTLLKREV